MKAFTPEKPVAVSRYKKLFPTLPNDVRRDALSRMDVLPEDEKRWCNEGNYKHIAQILAAIALYQILRRHGKSEPEAFRIISEAMWGALTPKRYQRMAKLPFFLPAMKKILPFGFRRGSGAGWRYTWRLDEDDKDRFRFECKECLYHHIFGDRGRMKRGAMFCHSDVINFGNLPYTDFKRTKTLFQNGDCCDFDFVRHVADAGNGWERSEII